MDTGVGVAIRSNVFLWARCFDSVANYLGRRELGLGRGTGEGESRVGEEEEGVGRGRWLEQRGEDCWMKDI